MTRTTPLPLDALRPRERASIPHDGGRRGSGTERPVFRPPPPSAWRHVDLTLVLCILAVSAIGSLMVLSSTRGTDPEAYNTTYLSRHVTYIAIGLVGMVLITLVDYRRMRDIAWLPYLIGLVLVVLVVSPLGTEKRGSQAWFQLGAFQLQPAEIAKVTTILAVAAFLSRGETPLSLRRLAGALAMFGVPVAFIMLQPDLGTSLVFVAIAMGMLLAARARMRHIVLLSAFGIIAIVGTLSSDLLEDYQRSRLTTFLEQDEGLQEATYNLNQSKIAIGSGGWGGKGLFEGTQTRLGNVPEQHTDFIFTALGEELGFVGSVAVLGLFAVICVRVWRTALIARDRLGLLICVGVLAMLVFQIFQNVGMTMGIMPITGITLPFMSYGGSATISTLLAMGLVLNVHMRRLG